MLYPTLKEEQQLWSQGYQLVAGLDEVGRGSFAGPVVVGAVVFPVGCTIIPGVADSKLLSARSRELLAVSIQQQALCWSVAEVGVAEINRVGIGRATQMAFRKALKRLPKRPDFVLIDAFSVKHFNRKIQRAIKNGDSDCFSIAAASIIAKVHRDRLMDNLDSQHPQYLWKYNKGYGTLKHREAITNNGLSKLHRHWKIG